MKDKEFYDTSGGGVTLSGGEALLQTEFCQVFLKEMKEQGVHTAVETAGYYKKEVLERLIDEIDLFLFDLKFIDPVKHKKYTGVDNARILENFAYASENAQVIVRIPLIPSVNDGEEFDKIIEFASQFETVKEVHILPFHNLGDSKYDQLQMNYAMKDTKVDNAKEMERCVNYAKKKGFRVSEGGAGL